MDRWHEIEKRFQFIRDVVYAPQEDEDEILAAFDQMEPGEADEYFRWRPDDYGIYCRLVAKETLTREFERSLDDSTERYLESTPHQIIGEDFFAAAATECRSLYVSGYFYGCITLCQSVAEGLARVISEKSSRRPGKDFTGNVRTLLRTHLIPEEVHEALLAVHGTDRNHFHHLNRQIPQEREVLCDRAKLCLDNLRIVEGWMFEVIMDGDNVRPVHPQFWPRNANGELCGYMRFMSEK
jgi:hypothetical protein